MLGLEGNPRGRSWGGREGKRREAVPLLVQAKGTQEGKEGRRLSFGKEKPAIFD